MNSKWVELQESDCFCLWRRSFFIILFYPCPSENSQKRAECHFCPVVCSPRQTIPDVDVASWLSIFTLWHCCHPAIEGGRDRGVQIQCINVFLFSVTQTGQHLRLNALIMYACAQRHGLGWVLLLRQIGVWIAQFLQHTNRFDETIYINGKIMYSLISRRS